jgi:hypothetical protein
MKNILFLIAVLFGVVGCNNTDSTTTTDTNTTTAATPAAPENALNDSTNYTSIQWLDSTHQDLGKIKEGQTPEISWRFKNVGDKPLVVINAQGTCGCTVAEKPEQPVAPGEEGTIKAKFSSEGRSGFQEKQVIVTTNTKGNTAHYLNFKVEVQKQ